MNMDYDKYLSWIYVGSSILFFLWLSFLKQFLMHYIYKIDNF